MSFVFFAGAFVAFDDDFFLNEVGGWIGFSVQSYIYTPTGIYFYFKMKLNL